LRPAGRASRIVDAPQYNASVAARPRKRRKYRATSAEYAAIGYQLPCFKPGRPAA